MDKIQKDLFAMQDREYGAFQARLIPSVPEDRVIGVRTPHLRKYAKKLAGTSEKEQFLSELPHYYFEENQLHAFFLSQEKDFSRCIGEVELFLPYIDNWATCDQLILRIFQKYKKELLPRIDQWLASGHVYTIRFGIKMLMSFYLDEDFELRYPCQVAEIRSEEYYVKMMIAWYFATALAKQYDEILPFLVEHRLDVWTHNKTIQKAVESFRITEEQKSYLKTLRIKEKRSTGNGERV